MVLPGLSSRGVSPVLRKYCFLSFHPDLDCSVYSNLVVITMGDVPAFAKIGTGGVMKDSETVPLCTRQTHLVRETQPPSSFLVFMCQGDYLEQPPGLG